MAEFPTYSFADEMMSPREMGIRRDGSFSGIMREVSGVNYYSDAIGFGTATGLAQANKLNQQPMGIRYFVKTGQTCSNGADLYEYVDMIPKGEMLGKRITGELDAMGLPRMRGLAPGIMEDATSALNPLPLLQAAAGTGYAKCKKVTYPVGDGEGRLKSRYDPDNVWIKDPIDKWEGRIPHQTRWILDRWISGEEYDKTPKTEEPRPVPAVVEGFTTAIHPVYIAMFMVLPLLILYVVVNVLKTPNMNAMPLITRGGGFLLVLTFVLVFLWSVGVL